MDTFKNTTEVRQGTWAGLGGPGTRGPARFFLKGNDVVFTDMNNNFVDPERRYQQYQLLYQSYSTQIGRCGDG